MRLLIVGSLNGYVSSAAKIAIASGAKVSHVPEIDEGLESLRSGKGADIVEGGAAGPRLERGRPQRRQTIDEPWR